jgi:hypothetical protein
MVASASSRFFASKTFANGVPGKRAIFGVFWPEKMEKWETRCATPETAIPCTKFKKIIPP